MDKVGGNRRFVREMIGFTDITGVADINVVAAVAAGGPSHFVDRYRVLEPKPPAPVGRCNFHYKLKGED